MEKERTYHVIRDGIKETITANELRMLQEGTDNVKCDIDWYLSHGYISSEEFKKRHP